MKTLIKIFDESPILNFLSAYILQPEQVIFIGSKRLARASVRTRIERSVKALLMETRVRYYPVDITDFNAILKTLRRITRQYPDCGIDLTGGNDILQAAVGMHSGEFHTPLFFCDLYQNKLINVYRCPEVSNHSIDVSLNCAQMITLAGGMIFGHGHISQESLSEEGCSDILKVWDIVRKYHATWSKQAEFFQAANRYVTEYDQQGSSDKLIVYHIEKRQKGKNDTTCQMNIMNTLEAAGILEILEDADGLISFRYKNQQIKKCLSDAGIWLELYTYLTAIELGIFSDAQLSLMIDWNGIIDEPNNVNNELDVTLVRGYRLIFISCKMGTPTVAAVNEIKTLTEKFGGRYAKAVLVTMSDMAKLTPVTYRRALESGVTVIDRRILNSGRLGEELLKL